MHVFGLLGNPVGHSLSPPMHEAAYDDLGMDARYVTFEPDPDDLGAAIDGADALGIAGLNVTIPFKEDALDRVESDEMATRVGAVNTIDFSGAEPTGHNTDVAGVRRAFAHHDVALAEQDAVVVGAGGAARATVFALADAGANSIHVANRTESRAKSLADDLDNRVTAGSLDTLESRVADATILVNATSVGMEEDCSPVPSEVLHGNLAVLDAVYRPLDTRLLREAREQGSTTIDGAWMLLYQGVEAFEQWTGRNAPVTEMNAALRARL